jgi:hypothetical protein
MLSAPPIIPVTRPIFTAALTPHGPPGRTCSPTPEHQHPLSRHRRIVEPAAAAERHPPLSHAQQSQSLTVNLKDAVTATVRKPQPGYLPGIGFLGLAITCFIEERPPGWTGPQRNPHQARRRPLPSKSR